MSKLGAPLTPYALAELIELHHSMERKRCRIIKKHLLDTSVIETPEAWSTAYTGAINNEARTLVLAQHYILDDIKPTAKGLHSSRPRPSNISKVNLSFDQLKKFMETDQNQIAAGIYDMVQKLGLMDLIKQQVTFRAKSVNILDAGVSTNVINVKRDPKSRFTKSIKFEIEEMSGFECVEETCIAVFISTNSNTQTAYVKLEYKPTHGTDKGKTWINECVLIFNQTSKVTFNTLLDYGVTLNRGMSEKNAKVFDDNQQKLTDHLMNHIQEANQTHFQLQAYFENRFSMYHKIARDSSKDLLHDKYIECFKTT
jgi:hypothetical protein